MKNVLKNAGNMRYCQGFLEHLALKIYRETGSDTVDYG